MAANHNGKMTSIVIFGATGDLTHRKLVPALFNLWRKGRMPEQFNIIGFARRPYSDDVFRDGLLEGAHDLAGLKIDDAQWVEFASRISYYQGNLDNADDYAGLQTYLQEKEGEDANRLYYLATAPEYYADVVTLLGGAGMAHEDNGAWRRLIIEKPFGTDLASAKSLNQSVQRVFAESQIYRIDHYLGKETVQNILFFRFTNTIFEPIWNRNYIDNVQITVAESVDVEHRAGYYDKAGVLRDMFQNHLLQLLALVAMEPPVSLDADKLRNEKVKVLAAVRPPAPQDAIHAQYDGYCTTANVTPNSQTPTYTALKLYVENWRWQGVPFYLRSGKALRAKTSEISIIFRQPPNVLFTLPDDHGLTSNALSLCIQPDEGIHLNLEAKVPDVSRKLQAVDLEFHYRDSFKDSVLPEAYERLLLDGLLGDAALFTRSDEIELAWTLIDGVLDSRTKPDAPSLTSYAKGSWGPAEADEFLARDGRTWRMGCLHEEH
jgi:glucose-6-phosphate 1-dehydrogenase